MNAMWQRGVGKSCGSMDACTFAANCAAEAIEKNHLAITLAFTFTNMARDCTVLSVSDEERVTVALEEDGGWVARLAWETAG